MTKQPVFLIKNTTLFTSEKLSQNLKKKCNFYTISKIIKLSQLKFSPVEVFIPLVK